MNTKKLHHYWVKIRPLRAWHFLLLALFFGLLSLVALRHNNLTAIKLRETLTTVDQQNGDVELALKNLRSYIYGHMNTNLSSGSNTIKPPIQLTYRYQRLVQTEKDRVSAANAAIYNDAQKYCEQQIPDGLSGRGRVPCIQDYVAGHGLKEQPINEDLYKFDFVSPMWSPDLAGWSIVLAAIFGIMAVGRFGLEAWLKRRLT